MFSMNSVHSASTLKGTLHQCFLSYVSRGLLVSAILCYENSAIYPNPVSFPLLRYLFHIVQAILSQHFLLGLQFLSYLLVSHNN